VEIWLVTDAQARTFRDALQSTERHMIELAAGAESGAIASALRSGARAYAELLRALDAGELQSGDLASLHMLRAVPGPKTIGEQRLARNDPRNVLELPPGKKP